MMPGIWQWYQDYATTHISQGNLAHLNMIRLYEMSTGAGSTEMTLSLLRQSREQAEALGETCFSLFLSHWVTEHLLWQHRDYAAALKNAAAAVVTFQDADDTCPLAERIYVNLLECYTEIDPGGYRSEIEDSLHYVWDNVPIDYEGRCMLHFRRGLMHLRLDELDAAVTAGDQCLAAAEGGASGGAGYYRALGTFLRAAVAFRRGQASVLQAQAVTGLNHLWAVSPQVYRAEFMLWAAFAAFQADDPAALTQFQRATTYAARHEAALSFAYYDVLAAWYAAQADVEKVQQVRTRQLVQARDRGAWLDAAEAHLALFRAGPVSAEQSQAARADIQRLREPTPYLRQLDTRNDQDAPQ